MKDFVSSQNTRGHTSPPVSCNDCQLSELCLPISLHEHQIEQLDQIIQRSRPLQKGSYIYRAHSPFHAVYVVRSGTIKLVNITSDGQEQVTGFYLPGEILGLDGIAKNHYTSSAIALETTAVCEIPFSRLEELSIAIPSLQRHFFQIMSHEIAQDQQMITLLGKNTAEERVAALLLSISRRKQQRYLSATDFILPMSRADIANYLGLTVETISRVLSRFQKQGILSVNKKEINITGMPALRHITESAGIPAG